MDLLQFPTIVFPYKKFVTKKRITLCTTSAYLSKSLLKNFTGQIY